MSRADDVLGFEQPLEDALRIGGGKINIDLSWRFAYVDDSTAKRQGYGDPFRFRIGYLTPEFHGLSAFAEYEGVQTVFTSKYNIVLLTVITPAELLLLTLNVMKSTDSGWNIRASRIQ